MTTKAQAEALVRDKLDESGLDHQDAQELGFVTVPDCSKLYPTFNKVAGLQLPYFHPRTGKPLTCKPGWPPFYRLRYLEQPSGDFASQTEGKHQRYTQEPDTGVCAYFPRNADWSKLLDDWTQPLLLTEGELKAAKACQEGFPTIGLGGVYNFRSAKLGLPWLDELDAVSWARRSVYIVYDSDFRTNPNVCAAINLLAEELLDRGALPHYVGLPDVYDEGKTGLDDFLVQASAEELRQLLSQEAQPLTMSRALWRLNSKCVYVQNPGLVVVKGSGQKISPAAFKEHAYAKEQHLEYSYDASGSLKMKKKAAAASWLKWPLRTEAQELTYAPGEEQLYQDAKGRFTYNTWTGWGCEPQKGDVTPFLKLVDHLFTGAEPEFKQWFLRWLAYPLQHPGTKMFSAMVIHGVIHGTGKSLLGTTMKRIYGPNFVKINQKDLERDYNDWAENRQFVMGDEITGSNKRSDADLLKDLITQQEVRINAKYVPIYSVPDRINYLFTSNHPDAFFLEDKDRRFAIHEVLVDVLPNAFYDGYFAWLDEQSGASALFQYLLDLDLGTFNPAAPAYNSAAKSRMIADSKSDLGAWCSLLAQAPDVLLRVGEVPLEKDLYTSKELLDLYDPLEKTRVSTQGMGTNLKKVGLRQVCGGDPVRVGSTQARYFAVRNCERWLRASLTDVAKHLEGPKTRKTKKQKF